MGGVDRNDAFIGNYACARKTLNFKMEAIESTVTRARLTKDDTFFRSFTPYREETKPSEKMRRVH